ncbi:pyruvate:ferredoxin (flavodoxin) oxidoreductase [Reinekea sp.]|uniref:pyruvate:ferredoxin (flavodoxin) oxidoreductase n=1 Tax=Reinekea sp. TaxID=1970455 RepID=UPI003988F372
MKKTTQKTYKMIDGNEAAVDVAFRLSEVCAIYPITPSSSMAELADEWKNQGRVNIWGQSPNVTEMQSEGGAAGAVHGALQSGSLATTFTSSQGLMLMIPNMHKIAGELTPTVFHVAARSLAAQALSIFGDHQDVMAVRNTGFALLSSHSVQQSHDLALIAHAATLQSRVPFIHFFDGFRTSHEVNKVEMIEDDVLKNMIDDQWVHDHRARSLNPENPVIRGTAQNPDVYFQGRESSNLYYQQLPTLVENAMEKFGKLTGRYYKLFDYIGDEDAERIIIIMGSGMQTVRQTVASLTAQGEKVGAIAVHLYRPFSAAHLLSALPKQVKKIAVLDRTKEPGSIAEPLYADVTSALSEAYQLDQITELPRCVGGRYGLSSKEFTPAMVKAVFDNLAQAKPKNNFTVGIIDDVSHSHLPIDESFILEPANTIRALFYGLGSDGTVGANKNSIKIIGEDDRYFAQGYFVYDSKKSGSQTISHLRFGPDPIDLPYLIQKSNFVSIHQFSFLSNPLVLANIEQEGTLLINAPYKVTEVWAKLPSQIQHSIIDKKLNVFVIDAKNVAELSGMGQRINTIMQTCFFALANVMPKDEALDKIRQAIKKSYQKKGDAIVQKNYTAIENTLANLHPLTIELATAQNIAEKSVSHWPDFVQQVTKPMMDGLGDLIPVSLIPVDGTYPSGTTQWEKRNIAQTLPKWQPDICIQCGNCSIVCPHAAIRAKFFHQDALVDAPDSFKSCETTARGFPETRYALQLYAEDCTGCGLCIEACPAISETDSSVKALTDVPANEILAQEIVNLAFFEALDYPERSRVDFSTVRGAQFLQPLFEFSGACAGCGETPYLKLVSQLFGDRMLVANATGCSSIYGGNLPTTPWQKNAKGHGPAWANSLFEDNAEFGLGFRLTADQHHEHAVDKLNALAPKLKNCDVEGLVNAAQITETEIEQQRQRVSILKEQLEKLSSSEAKELASVADQFVRRSVWIVGGDGWAYDIGYGGLDHVLASGRDVNVLVMDTEVYSNTGGQMSKATPLGAVAKFSAGGKPVGKKDLALQAIAYGNVYVARIAFGANPQQALQALREAEAYPGPSLILAYSHCIAHGIDMRKGLEQQKLAVATGHWPLLRYNPLLRQSGENPFELDCLPPHIPLSVYRSNEQRYVQLQKSHPEEAKRLNALASEALALRWDTYEDMANRSAQDFQPMYE